MPGMPELQLPLQRGVVRMQRQRLGSAGRFAVGKSAAQRCLAAGHARDCVHAPAEERPLGDAVGGEAPDQQAVHAPTI